MLCAGQQVSLHNHWAELWAGPQQLVSHPQLQRAGPPLGVAVLGALTLAGGACCEAACSPRSCSRI